LQRVALSVIVFELELDAYQKLAQIYLSFSDAGLAKALNAGELEEVKYNGEEVSE
jgi:hypothetical protein